MSKPPKMPEATQRAAWGWEDEYGAAADFMEKTQDVINAEVERRRELVWRDGWKAGHAAALEAITKAAAASAEPPVLRLAGPVVDGSAEYASWDLDYTRCPRAIPETDADYADPMRAAPLLPAGATMRDAEAIIGDVLHEGSSGLVTEYETPPRGIVEPSPTEREGRADQDAADRTNTPAGERASDQIAGPSNGEAKWDGPPRAASGVLLSKQEESDWLTDDRLAELKRQVAAGMTPHQYCPVLAAMPGRPLPTNRKVQARAIVLGIRWAPPAPPNPAPVSAAAKALAQTVQQPKRASVEAILQWARDCRLAVRLPLGETDMAIINAKARELGFPGFVIAGPVV